MAGEKWNRRASLWRKVGGVAFVFLGSGGLCAAPLHTQPYRSPGQPALSALARHPSPSPSPLYTQYQGVWHCIVGRNFGSYVTHEAKHHIYFYAGQTAVLLFKTG